MNLLGLQSTINPNMAIRLLMYAGRIYEKIIDIKKVYSTKRFTIPQPEFIVLYNGSAPYPEEAVIKLSESFENIESLGLPVKTHPALELIAKIININQNIWINYN